VPTATIQLGATADWVATTADAVWVGSTGPFAVNHVDPLSNKLVAAVLLPGEPCAGLAVGFGSVWIPLCTRPATLAKVDLIRNVVTAVFEIGPAAAEGGITTSPDSVWLVTDKSGSLARIDPGTGKVRQTVHLPPGSYNPLYVAGVIWVTRAEGAEVTRIDARSGDLLGTVRTGPGPRFLAAGGGAVWTLNQGDGTLTRIGQRPPNPTATVPLGTPGHGGDINFGAGWVWTTMSKVPLTSVSATGLKVGCQWVGPGGDSLGIGHNAIWLTDYHAGTVSRFELPIAVSGCGSSLQR
jgi:streptogramin lyase